MSAPGDESPVPLLPTAAATLHELLVLELRAAVQRGADPVRLRSAATVLLRSARPDQDGTGMSDPADR